MVKSKRSKELIPERIDPGDPEPEKCSPGSIEQQLDMCEGVSFRGDEVLGNSDTKPAPTDPGSRDPYELPEELYTFEVTMEENDREGDEQSGDDHSRGLQGGEEELKGQRHIDQGIPGQEVGGGQFENVVDIFSEREKIRMRKKAARSKK